MEVVMLPNCYLEDFLFMISGYNMAPTCDSDMKNYSVSKTSTSESKIYNIWPTLRHVWDMSKTFPTKPTPTAIAAAINNDVEPPLKFYTHEATEDNA